MRAPRGTSPAADDDDGRYLRAGHSPDILRKLRRMHWPVGDELDLHGLTGDEAAAALDAFLADVRAQGIRCVRVIHGKGLRSSGGEAVLRRLVRRLLAQRDDVLAFVEPSPAQGGSGAVVVLVDG